MADLQKTMREDPGVGKTSSLADVILRSYQVFADEPAAAALPDDAALVAQMVFLSQSPALERYVDRAYGRSVIVGLLDGADSGVPRRVISRLRAYLAAHATGEINVRLAGGRAGRVLALNDDTVNDKIISIVMVLAAILLISSVLLRSFVGGALVAAPLVMALLVNLAIFAIFGVAFDLVGASIAAVGVGMGADFAIYFLYRWQEELKRGSQPSDALSIALASSGSAVLFVALAISAGFSVYLVSSFYSLRMLGTFIPTTMAVSSLTALTLLPSATLRLRPRFLFGEDRSRGGATHAVAGLGSPARNAA
jgi:predicted RND superfamily exporter protein